MSKSSPNWCLLRPVTKRLACDEQWKVRRMVAASMHELAVIVGPGAATRDLLPVYTDLIKDLDEVRIGALRILSRFLYLLKPEGRVKFLPMFNKFVATDYEWNWRFRAEFVEQLALSLGFFQPQQIWDYLAPLALLLLSDKVATVRRVAIDLVDELFVHLAPSPTLTRCLTTTLAEDFAHSPSWTQRQTFASLCARLISESSQYSGSVGTSGGSTATEGSLLSSVGWKYTPSLPVETFACDLLPHLLDLARDSVPNVRLCVARTLALHVAPLPYFQSPCPHSDVLINTLLTLMSDPDSDVRYYATLKPESQDPDNIATNTTDTEVNESYGDTEDSTSSSDNSPTSKMMKTSSSDPEDPEPKPGAQHRRRPPQASENRRSNQQDKARNPSEKDTAAKRGNGNTGRNTSDCETAENHGGETTEPASSGRDTARNYEEKDSAYESIPHIDDPAPGPPESPPAEAPAGTPPHVGTPRPPHTARYQTGNAKKRRRN
ncbi:hypothetical protein M8J75_008807 [Diaphorina citri]|nr:hypothetical protein M8J75_008807 [Diaphorina citri]